MKQQFFFIFLAVLCCRTAHAQVVSPAQNKPVTPTPLPPATIVYPGLYDHTNLNLRNFKRVFVPQKPTTTSSDISLNNINNGTINEMPVKTVYSDGLGRPIQEVFRKGAGAFKNLHVPHAYDQLGRESVQYLPFNSDFTNGVDGTLNTQPLTRLSQQYANAYPNEQPYSQLQFDNSPLNAVKKKSAPGANWVGSNRGVSYETNADAAYVIKWAIVSDAPVFGGFYSSGSLDVTKATDEDGHVAMEYRDKQGRLILRRRQISNSVPSLFHPDYYTHTYNVYDDMGRLRYVISPEAIKQSTGGNWQSSWSLSTDVLNGLCYKYSYDDQGRIKEKKLPGKEPEQIVYDSRGRAVFSRDGKQTVDGKWVFTIYDVMNRPIMTGLYNSNATQSQMISSMSSSSIPGAGTIFHYLKQNLYHEYPSAISGCEILIYTYYDDYAYSDLTPYTYDPSLNSKLTGQAPQAVLPVVSYQTYGLITGKKVKVMDQNSSVQWLTSAYYYDDRQQVIQTIGNNIKAGLDISSNQYEFDGTLISNVIRHNNPSAISPVAAYPSMHQHTEVVTKFIKDYKRGTVTGSEMNINGTGWRKISSVSYNDFGKIGKKTLGVDFANHLTYNIRGWLTGINDYYLNGTAGQNGPFFGESLSYNQGFASKLYSGNIAGIMWKNAGAAAKKRFYGYTYDMLNRLNHAEFGQWQSSGAGSWEKNEVDYTASGISYDYNGNIKSMNQRGPGYLNNNLSTPGMVNMDVLTYSYQPASNRLLSVADNNSGQLTNAPDFKDGNTSGNDYEYDVNGNQILDKNKGIYNNILYSYLNKPTRIIVNGKGTVEYVYDALGNQLQKKFTPVSGAPETVDYISSFIYQDNKLKYLFHDDGRCRPQQTSTDGTARFDYDYFVKDHLGNVRTVVYAEATGLGPLLNPTEYKAGMEIALANTENLLWDYVDEVRDDKPGGTPGDLKAARLDGDDPHRRIGTAIMLRVMPGDKFKVGATTFWEGQPDNDIGVSSEMLAASLLTTLTGGNTYSGVPIREIPENVKTIESSVGNAGFATAWQNLHNQNYDDHTPDGGLNYIVLDENYRVVEGQSGVLQVGNVPGEWNNVQTSDAVAIEQPGYVVVFLGSRTRTPIFADNVWLTFYKGSVLEENHYYPYGLALSQATVAQAEKNNFKYQGIDLNKKFDLELYETYYRGLDPQLGRFLQIDPKAEYDFGFSTYSSMRDNPVANIDPFGDCVKCAEEAAQMQAAAMKRMIMDGTLWQDANGKWFQYDAQFGAPMPYEPEMPSTNEMITINTTMRHHFGNGQTPNFNFDFGGTPGWWKWANNMLAQIPKESSDIPKKYFDKDGGGTMFTSADGQNQEERGTGHPDAKMESIDNLTALTGNYGGSGTFGSLNDGLGRLEDGATSLDLWHQLYHKIWPVQGKPEPALVKPTFTMDSDGRGISSHYDDNIPLNQRDTFFEKQRLKQHADSFINGLIP